MWIKLVVLALGAVVFHRIITLVDDLNLLKNDPYKHHPGPCQLIPDINHGAEDIERLPGNKAIFTAGLRLIPDQFKNTRIQGKVYLFDFDQPELGAQPVTITNWEAARVKDFSPHGLSTYTDDITGEMTVFIVNHSPTWSVVDLFTYDQKNVALIHKETIGFGDSNMKVLNDVLAVGTREFYATNFFYYRSVTLTKLDFALGLNSADVIFYDGKETKVVAQGLSLANGINQSPDGRYIYVSNFGKGELITYTRNHDNTLTPKQVFDLGTNIDNIDVDPATGDLWCGCVPLLGKAFNLEPHMPSQVLRLKMKEGHIDDITEVLVSDGKYFPGSSVAMLVNNNLFVGSAFHKAMVCDVKTI